MQYSLSNGKDHVYQWDHDITLTIADPEDVPQVHFRWGNRAVPFPVENQQVAIPPELMQLPQDIVIWAYTPEHTMDMAKITLKTRPKPNDYVYTPTEIKTWEALDERIKALEGGGGVAGVSSVNGQTGAVTITAEGLGALTEDNLQDATDKALAQAKASGEFDGAQGPQGETGPQGPKGNTGADGPPGKDGVTPNIQIGTVTTLDAGSDATASMTGTAAELLLNLGIPKGADGSAGGASGEWELLATQEALEEDVIKVHLSVPNRKKYKVLVSLVNSAASAGARALQIALNDDNNTKTVTGSTQVINASGTRSVAAFLRMDDNRCSAVVYNNLNGDGIVDGTVENMTNVNFCGCKAPSVVSSLDVSNLNAVPEYYIGAGSRIKVYGGIE